VAALDVLEPSRVGQSRRRRRSALRLDTNDLHASATLVQEVADLNRAASPRSASVAALAGAMAWVETTHRDALLQHCGPTRHLVTDLCTYITRTRIRFAAIVAVGGQYAK
jgi:hypothetical protein